MAIVTSFLIGSAFSVGQNLGGNSFFAENVLDFAETSVSSGDVVQAIKVPNGAMVVGFWLECLTAEGGVATVNLGDGGDVDGYDATVNVNSAAGVIKGDGAYVGGRRYSADDTIDVIPTADLDTAKIRVVVQYIILELS
jgi:hypothetical protein